MDNRSINPYDLRMLNLYLKENKITKEEYDAHIKSLDDLSDNIEEVDIQIKDSDLRIDVFRAGGPGGQSVNTTYSAIKLHHEPTGLIVSCQDQKSQHKNLEKALKVLRTRLYELELSKKLEEDSQKRSLMVSSGDRSAKIRTYNYPQGRVTDHRINLTLYDLQNIVNGDIDKLIDELKVAQNTELMKNENENL